jgi:hypothetical protein
LQKIPTKDNKTRVKHLDMFLKTSFHLQPPEPFLGTPLVLFLGRRRRRW